MNNLCIRLRNGKSEKEIDNGDTLARRKDCKSMKKYHAASVLFEYRTQVS